MELQNRNSGDMKEEEYKLKIPERTTFYDGVKRHFKSYCEISSIQGLNYMVKDGVSTFERIWWILVFVFCVGGCSYMIFELIDKWISSPVLVTLATKETPIHTIPFPAVTICPETKISRKCLNYTETLVKRRSGKIFEINLRENIYFDYMSLLCNPHNHESTTTLVQEALNDSLPLFKSKSTKDAFKLDDYAEFLDSCKSVTLSPPSYCEWMGTEMNCTDVLTPVLTDEGLCYSFNMFDVRDIYSDVNTMKYYNESRRNPDWDPDTGYPQEKINNIYPRRAFLNGAKNALVVVLFTKKSDIYYACRDFALQGIRVSVNQPARIPTPSQIFFSVGLDRLTTVALTPSLMSTTPAIKAYDPEERSCYFVTERKLKYFKVYSQANCNLECWTNYTIAYCGCTHFYMPRDANTSICNLDHRFCLEEARINFPISLLSEKLQLKSETKKVKTSNCNCLPICSSLSFDSEISSGKWDYGEDVQSTIAQDYHASAVKVFFKTSYFLPTEKSELYDITSFISNTGGILGLFTGFSLFSLAEIIYYLSVKVIENYRRHGYWAGERTSE